MANEPETPVQPGRKRRKLPTTPEEYEARLIGLAYKAAEKSLIDGTASSQIQALLIKEGTVRAELERERLRKENSLTQAKIDNMEQLGSIAELLEEAKNAMITYQTGKPMPKHD